MSSMIFFVNIGPTLAKEINPHTDDNFVFPHGISDSMFLGGVCESDVLEVVRKFKNKTSNDCNTIDMSLIKDVIDCVVGPFTYICNILSIRDFSG